MPEPLAVSVLVAAGGLLTWLFVRNRRRPAVEVGAWAQRLDGLGLQLVASRSNADFCTTEWFGGVGARPLRLRILERPGSRFVLFWVRVALPGRLPEGLSVQWGRLGVGRVRVKEVEGGYRLVCTGTNPHQLMGDVELGLPAFDHGGAFGIQAQVREGLVELGSAGCPPGRVGEDVRELVGLVEKLSDAADAPWREAAERFGLLLLDHDAGGTRRIGGRARLVDLPVEAGLEMGQTVVRVRHGGAIRGIRVVHKDLDRGEPTGNPMVDMLVSCQGRAAAIAELLADEDRVAALLAVVHAYKGSELSSKEVVLRAHGELREGLGDAIAVALDLGRRL